MMTVHTIKSAKEAGQYFQGRIQERAPGDYYAENTGYNGEWMGNGAAALGLKGAVDKEVFVAALEGHLPGGIEIAYKADGTHRPGIDTTYSAPKSISYIYSGATDPRVREVVLAAQASAVKKTQAWSEQHQVFARKGQGGTIHELTNSQLAAAFCHIEVRPVGGVVEPGIHTHVVRINATQREDGKWVAANVGVSEDWIKLEGAIYRSHLALDLQRGMGEIGYAIEIVPERMESGDMGFQVGGFTQEEIRAGSRRSAVIDAELLKLGKTRATATTAEKQAANYRTREAKSSQTPEALRAEWRERHGEAVDRVLGQAQVRDHAPVSLADAGQAAAIAATNAVQSAQRHFSERQSAYASGTLASYAIAHTVGLATVEDVEKAIKREIDAGRLVKAIPNPERPKEKRYTTREAIQRETTFIRRIERGIGAVEPINPNPTIEPGLGKAQAAAVTHILTSSDRFNAWQGQAGSGKTTAARTVVVDVMSRIRAESEAQGTQIIGVGPTHRAKNELRDAGVTDVRTAKQLLIDARTGKLQDKCLYIVDESGMLSAKEMAELIRTIERSEGRAIFIGDTRQLQSVEAGNPFRQMQQHTTVSVLDEIHRQKNEQLRECVQAFAKGDAKGGAELAKAFITEVPNAPDADRKDTPEFAKAAASHYLSLTPEEREKTLLITGTNAVRIGMNEVVRNGLQESGEIGQENNGVRHLEKVDFTKEEARQAINYKPAMKKEHVEGEGSRIGDADDRFKPNMVVEFRRDYQNRGVSEPVEKGKQYVVTSVDDKVVTLKNHETGQTLEWQPDKASKVTVSRETKEDLALSTGDKIIFRVNDKEAGVHNGDKGIVLESTPDKIRVELTNGKEIEIKPERGGHVEYAYAGTVHSAQGATCDRVIVAANSRSPTATAEQGYVSLSRARQEATVYTNSTGGLTEKWSEFKERETAREAVGIDPTPTKNKDTAHQTEESTRPPPTRGGEDFQRSR